MIVYKIKIPIGLHRICTYFMYNWKNPDNIMRYINNVTELKDSASVEALYNSIINFNNWYTSDRQSF